MSFPWSNQESPNNMSRQLPAWMQPSGEPDWSSRNNPWDTSLSEAPTQSPPRPDNPHPPELTLAPLVLSAVEAPSPEVSSAADSLLLLALNAVRSLPQQTPDATESLTEESRFEAESLAEEASSHTGSQIKWTAINDEDIYLVEASTSVDEYMVEAPTDGGEDLLDGAASDNEDGSKEPEEELDDDEDPAEGAASEGESPEQGKRRRGICKDCSMPVRGRNHRCPECKKKLRLMQERRRYDRVKEQGKCPRCLSRIPTKGSVVCDRCGAARRAACHKAKEENICCYCRKNEPVGGGMRCEACREYQRKYRREGARRRERLRRIVPIAL